MKTAAVDKSAGCGDTSGPLAQQKSAALFRKNTIHLRPWKKSNINGREGKAEREIGNGTMMQRSKKRYVFNKKEQKAKGEKLIDESREMEKNRK